MTSIIIQLDSAKTTGEINQIMSDNLKHFNSSTILDYVARKSKKRINKKRFCPVCGCNQLFKHNIIRLTGEWVECGTWRVYEEIDEPGEYKCMNDHSFRVEYDEQEDRIYIIK